MRVTAKSVLEAAQLAMAGKQFEVVYYPRASTAEFCVEAGLVKSALEHSWYAGMRFKMAFETEDSSRISWFMGTIAAVQPTDPVLWPNSPWRVLQVCFSFFFGLALIDGVLFGFKPVMSSHPMSLLQ